MPKRMVIDASHPEETRVVVLDGSRVEEFDFESATKRPLKGNIYLAKVTRVEPSLQAAFVEYGGNRQGFLAFSEIHPDYYQIPVADRMAILQAQTERMMAEEDVESIDSTQSDENAPASEDASQTENGDSAETSNDTTVHHGADEDPQQTVETAVRAEGEVVQSGQAALRDAIQESSGEPEPEGRGAAWSERSFGRSIHKTSVHEI